MLFVTILFNLYNKHLNKEACEKFGDFKTGGKVRVIHTVKHANDFVLLAKEEMVLQGMTDKLIETGRCYGISGNECGKN
jgi:hypothetical protein